MSKAAPELARTDRQTALLRWAIENQSDERKLDVEQSKEFMKNLDPKWMEALLGTADNDTDKMRALIAELKKDDLADEDRVDCLEELTFVCELTHNANALHKLDGLGMVLGYFTHSSPKVRTAAADLIATCVPNNVDFRKQLLENDAFPKIVSASKSDDPIFLKKILLCLSGYVRDFPPVLKQFSESDEALSSVVASLSSSDARVGRRAAFFLSYLLHAKSPDDESEFLLSSTKVREDGVLDALIGPARSDDSDLREKSRAALKEFAKRGKSEIDMLRQLGAADVLR